MARKKYTPSPITGFCILLGSIIFAWVIANIGTIQSLELDFLDYRFKLRGPLDISESPIVILAIDDQSNESTPEQWPWPRRYFAHVIENLFQAGASVIGIDVEFDKAGRHGPASDNPLEAALNRYDNVVLVGKIFITSGRLESTILVPPYENFRRTGVPWGLVSSEVDKDGIYRRYLVAQRHMDTTYASFATEVLKIHKGYDKDLMIEDRPGRFICGEYEIPKFDHYSMLINYTGPAQSFPVYSFDNVLDDEDFDLLDEYDMNAFDDPGDTTLGLPPGLLHSGILKDKIVLIGATMQELHDDFPTPFLEVTDESGHKRKALTPGVEVHANALQTILSENYLAELDLWGLLVILFLLGILVYTITHFLPTLWGAISSTLIAFLYFAFSVFLFIHNNLIIEITTPVFLILFSFIGNNLYQYVLSQKEKRMIQGAFSHYVPEKVVAEILADPDKLKLGGEERIVTVLFSDVEGFTTISEKLTPVQLVHLLNEYLTEMSEIVLSNNGIIDKYEGDAIMAEFGVPVPYDNHGYMACKTALEMQRKLSELREKWETENRPLLTARIGINTGEVIVGNMGSRNVFDYTVVGDHVNLGSRLEGANKFYGTRVMISEFTHEHVKEDFYTRMLDMIRVMGKEEPRKVYELIAFKTDTLDDQVLEMLNYFDRGTQYYRSRMWDKAIHCFEHCLKLRDEDIPSHIYRRRCNEFKLNPPDVHWDGVTVMEEK